MKKIILIFFLLINYSNLSYAVSTIKNGQGNLELSEQLIQDFYSYITIVIRHNPINFFISEIYRAQTIHLIY